MTERYVDLEGAYNFRDIGGYRGKDGKKVVFGKLFRSDELSKLTSADVTKLEELGLKTIIDYRNEKERKNNEDITIKGAQVIYLDPIANIAALASTENGENVDIYDMSKMTAQLAKELMTVQNVEFVKGERSQAVFKEMLELVLDQRQVPLVQHCRGGKDRTGYGIALILLLLGVSQEEVLRDYLLTNYYKKDKNEQSLAALMRETNNQDLVQAMRYFKEADSSFLETALQTINSEFGGIENYVREILNFSDEKIQRLRELYLTE